MYLDSEFPTLRQQELLKTSKVSVIISDSEDAMSGWKLAANIILSSMHKLYIYHENNTSHEMVPSSPPECKIAYVIHTSGSTGTPKAVRVPHSCILPNILDLRYLRCCNRGSNNSIPLQC